jgi:phosphate transport system protein
MATQEHTTKAFDIDLQEITRLLAEMGGLAEKQIADSVDALVRGDANLAQQVVATDSGIDALWHEIEEKACSRSPVVSRWRWTCARL